jgi:anti-anti-sigma factor
MSPELDELQPGGIGLHLMRKMMDEVQFHFEHERNVLTMVKMQAIKEIHPVHAGVRVNEVRSHVWLIAPEGRLDAASVPQLEDALNDVLNKGRIWLIMDMRQVSYISSRGLKTLVSSWRRAGDAGGNLVLFGMVSRVSSVFDTVGFTSLFDIYETLDDAIAAAEAKGY